jgi:hypothetical protein
MAGIDMGLYRKLSFAPYSILNAPAEKMQT